MAEEEATENHKSLIDLVEEHLFDLQCLIKANEIRCSAHCEIGRKTLLAFSTESPDLALYYQRDSSSTPIIKRIPWFQGSQKAISALCFDPSGSWLLVASFDGSLHVVPALASVDKNASIDHKWATNDVTSFSSVSSQSSYSKPTALVWWQGVAQRSHVGIIGTERGEIVLINLESGEQVGSTHVKGDISSLHICPDNSLLIDNLSLLITCRSRQQWRLLLEQFANGYAYPLDSGKPFHRSYPLLNTNDSANDYSKIPTTRSRLQGLKQLSAEKLAVLKQKLVESKNRNITGPISRRDSSSSSGTDEIISIGPRSSSDGTVDTLHPELIPGDVFLTPQSQNLHTSYHLPTHLLTIFERNTDTEDAEDISVDPLYVHKMPRYCKNVLLTQRFFYVTDVQHRSLCIIPRYVGESEFNPESVIARFYFENSEEIINSVYRVTDFRRQTGKEACGNENKYTLPKKVEELKVEMPLMDTCVVVTNFAVYKVVLRKSPLSVFMDLVLKRKDLEKARRLAVVFGMNIQQLLEYAGDIVLSNKEFPQALMLYTRLSKWRLVKCIFKFASVGYTFGLLSCITHCLMPPAVTEMPTATRIHLSNLSVLAYTELTLRASLQHNKHIHKEFLYFLSTNTFYDELLAVNVTGQTCLWNVLHQLATQRGLYGQVLDVLMKTVLIMDSSTNSHLLTSQNKYGLLICLSESNLIQAMLVNPTLAKSHIAFVLSNLSTMQIFVLQRLITLYDPTNAVLRPLLVRYRARHRTTSHSSQSSQCDSLDLAEVLEEGGMLIEEILETFLFILLTLTHKKVPKSSYNPMLMQFTQPLNDNVDRDNITRNVDFKRRLLSAGFAHVALIRNGNVYTWGNASQGCLGTGPSISRYGSPKIVPFFQNMGVEVLSVSCGRCHTLAVTNNGIYAWGGSQFGQLGLGKVLQCPSPMLVTSLAQEVIVDAVAGQYHSVALTMDGRVFTWGWGVHGQLGHGNTDEKNIPTLVSALLGIVVRHISAGHAHTLILSAEGIVYVFGSNIYGQLGNGTKVKSSLPVIVTLLPEKISLISTGYFHNLAVSHTNKLYTWGASPQVLRLQAQAQKKSRISQQRAATEKREDNFETFEKDNELVNGNVQVNDGRTQSNENYSQNTNDTQSRNGVPNGPQLANGMKIPRSPSLKGINVGMLEEAQTHLKPSLVDTSFVNGQIVQISTGCHHSALLTKDGSVYTWGRNLDGQIGYGNRRDFVIPTPLSCNPASILAKVPPRSKIAEKKQTLDLGWMKRNEHFKAGSGSNDDASRTESLNAAEDAQTFKASPIVKTVRISCGCDYTVAVQPGGTVLAWGSNSMAQLGRQPMKDARGIEEKLVLLKSSKRVIRLPHAAHTALDTPSQVPGIPTPIISYQSYDVTPLAGLVRPLSVVEKIPGELTLHYALEQFYGLYDSTKIMNKCIELGNNQACSKLAYLERNFSEALSYQLKASNASNLKSHAFTPSSAENSNKTGYPKPRNRPQDTPKVEKSIARIRHMKENIELFDKQVEKNLIDTMEECAVHKKVKMPSSKSLDSFLILDQELHTFDCQGGSEELCEDSRSDDISLDITEDALENETDNPSEVENTCNSEVSANEPNVEVADIPKHQKSSNKLDNHELKNSKNNAVHEATNITSFYISEIEEDAHTTMHEVLQSALDFWIKHNLPMHNLENALLEHLNKIFYPLGLLLFCQNNAKEDEEANKIDVETKQTSRTMHFFSTKFCLQVCSMFLRYVGQGKPIPEYIKLLSQLTAKHYGSPLTGYPGSSGNRTPEQMMDGVISTIPSGSYDPRPFIHIKDPNEESRFLAVDEDIMVFSCGHHFPHSLYQSEVIPGMEAELLMSKPLPLPCTAQLLGHTLSQPGKVETLCPLCIPPALQSIVQDVVDE